MKVRLGGQVRAGAEGADGRKKVGALRLRTLRRETMAGVADIECVCHETYFRKDGINRRSSTGGGGTTKANKTGRTPPIPQDGKIPVSATVQCGSQIQGIEVVRTTRDTGRIGEPSRKLKANFKTKREPVHDINSCESLSSIPVFAE